jgi:hypothetical protein
VKLLSINELADLTSKQRPTIGRRVAHLAPKKRGKSVLIPSDLALEAIYEIERRKVTESNSSDKARRDKAEADLAEIRLGKERGTLGLLSEIENLWADGIERGVSEIEKLKSLNDGQKTAVFAALRGIQIKVKDDA